MDGKRSRPGLRVIYFDNQAIQGWAPGEDCGILVYLEDLDHSVGPPTHPRPSICPHGRLELFPVETSMTSSLIGPLCSV